MSSEPPKPPGGPESPATQPPPGPPVLTPALADGDVSALASAPASVTDEDLVDAVGAKLSRKERKKRERDKELERIEAEAEAEATAAGLAVDQAKTDRAAVKPAAAADDDEDPDEALDPAERAERKGRRRTMVLLAITIAIGLLATAFIILGRINKDRYYITCGATQIRAEQGRGFPPWGSAPLDGPEWKAITIPPNAECNAHEADDIDALSDEFRAALVEQARVRLGAKDVTELELAAAQLEQALLLTRDPRRRIPRSDIDRLLGDVEYWRAMARLRAATDEIGKAAAQFDTAATKVTATGDTAPVEAGKGFKHVDDASAWAGLARRAADLLRGGPTGQAAAPVTAGSGAPAHVPAPLGVALPVETPDAAPAEPPAEAPPDAGLPTGGVLL